MNIAMNVSTLQLQHVNLEINGQQLIQNLSLHISPGEITTLMGASGCGKSSLLDFICGTLASDFNASGSICLGEQCLDGLVPEQRGVGILFQDDLLFAHLSVGGNLAFALPSRLTRSQRHERITQALHDSGLEGMADRDPATLSGGQRARVTLLRTLLAEPKALLLDEPFSKLDPNTRQHFQKFVFEHVTKAQIPVLLVTHDQQDANAAGGKIVSLD